MELKLYGNSFYKRLGEDCYRDAILAQGFRKASRRKRDFH